MEGLRKVVTVVEDVHEEGGRAVDPPVRIAAAGAVIVNPFAGRFVDDLDPLIEAYCEPLGTLLTARALELLGGEAEAYGKGALVGIDGEVEHGSAIIHNLRFGDRVRDPVDGTSLLPSAEKRGPPGAPLDLAIKHKSDHRVRSHHQTFEVRIPDAPRPGEIVIWVALASSGRPQSRLGEFGSELATAS
jgi:amino acid synthesis protein